MINTHYGFIDETEDSLELGEIVVTDEGVELEVTQLEPLTFELAPEEAEDWGE